MVYDSSYFCTHHTNTIQCNQKLFPSVTVWAGSANECGTFGQMLYARKKRLLLMSALSGQELS